MLNSYLIYIFAENHKSTLMKPTTYIDWDGLKDIPFFDIIFGENFDGENLDTLTPLTKKRFDYLCKRIKELDPYATI